MEIIYTDEKKFTKDQIEQLYLSVGWIWSSFRIAGQKSGFYANHP